MDKDLETLLVQYYRDTLGIHNWEQAVERRMNIGLQWSVKTLAHYVTIDQTERLLDIGCGFGDFLIEIAQVSNHLHVGLEPDIDWGRMALKRIQSKRTFISCAVGEHLPYGNGTFDGIFSNQVLEHVQDLQAVLTEIWRVCAPGGWIYLTGPNYLIPYESHYRIPLLPWLPKKIGALILKKLGRNPTYLQYNINFINPFMVLKIFKKLGVFQVRNLVQDYLRHPEMIASDRLRRLVSIFKWIPWPAWFVYLLSPTFIVLLHKPETEKE